MLNSCIIYFFIKIKYLDSAWDKSYFEIFQILQSISQEFNIKKNWILNNITPPNVILRFFISRFQNLQLLSRIRINTRNALIKTSIYL